MKKVVPKLRQEVKVKVDIVNSDDIKNYCTGKFQHITARYIIKNRTSHLFKDHHQYMNYSQVQKVLVKMAAIFDLS